LVDYTLRNGCVVTVRQPVADDVDLLNELSILVSEETKFIHKIELGSDSGFLAEYKGQVVGQCSVEIVRGCSHRAEISLVLLKDYYDLGVGGALMTECLSWCKEYGVEQAELSVLADNVKAIRMYGNFGFKTVGALPHMLKYPDGRYGDGYFMVKSLV